MTLVEKVFKNVRVGDRCVAGRDLWVGRGPAAEWINRGTRGEVTMKCRDGLHPSRMMVRILWQGVPGEHLTSWPTRDVLFEEG